MTFKINDYVYYALNGICIISDIKEMKIGNEIHKYYVLSPINGSSINFFIPSDNKEIMNKIKKVLSKEEIDKLIIESINVEIIWHKNSKDRNVYFQNLLKQDDLKITIAIIRTIIEKQEVDNKMSPSDLLHLANAENLVHSSLTYSLNITKDEVKDYILNIINKK